MCSTISLTSYVNTVVLHIGHSVVVSWIERASDVTELVCKKIRQAECTGRELHSYFLLGILLFGASKGSLFLLSTQDSQKIVKFGTATCGS